MTPTSKEEKLKEFKEQFTYGILYSASSDLTAGKGTHFKQDNAAPAITWLSSLIDDLQAEKERALEEYKNALLAELKDQDPADYENPEGAKVFCAGYNACKEFVEWVLAGKPTVS
jgi:hypothetical protein